MFFFWKERNRGKYVFSYNIETAVNEENVLIHFFVLIQFVFFDIFSHPAA